MATAIIVALRRHRTRRLEEEAVDTDELDADHDGNITAAEIKPHLSKLSISPPKMLERLSVEADLASKLCKLPSFPICIACFVIALCEFEPPGTMHDIHRHIESHFDLEKASIFGSHAALFPKCSSALVRASAVSSMSQASIFGSYAALFPKCSSTLVQASAVSSVSQDLLAEALEPLHESIQALQAALEKHVLGPGGGAKGDSWGFSRAVSPPPAIPDDVIATHMFTRRSSGESTSGSQEMASHWRQSLVARTVPGAMGGQDRASTPENSPARGRVQIPSSASSERMGIQLAVSERPKQSYLATLVENRVTRSNLLDEAKRHHFTTKLTNALFFCLDAWERLEEPWRTGTLYRIESSTSFSSLSSFVILLNAAFVWGTANWEMENLGWPKPGWVIALEWSFLAFFSLELLLRVVVHRMFFFVNQDMKWNIFDLLLVVISAVDAIVELATRSPVSEAVAGDSAASGDGSLAYMRIMRLFKLAKILRALRVMKVFRALANILDSFVRCTVSLFWSLVMLVFMLYVFSLVFMQGVASFLLDMGHDESTKDDYLRLFGSVRLSMLTLYMAVTGGDDWSVFYRMLEPSGTFYAFAFLAFTFLFSFAIFNILTGIFVERAVEASKPDREEQVLEHRKRLINDAAELKQLCHLLDIGKTGKVSLDEFKESMKNPTLVAYMASVGLEVHDVDAFFSLVQAGSKGEIDIDMFVEQCMAMKGQATSLETRGLMDFLVRFERALDRKMERLLNQMPRAG